MKRSRYLLNAAALFIPLFVLMDGGSAHNAFAQDGLTDTPLQHELSAKLQLFDNYTLDLNDLATLYQLRGYKQAWRTSSEDDLAALAPFVDTMESFARLHGLQSDHAPAVMIRKLLAKPTDENALKLELLISDWLIKIAHDLYGDKVELSQLYVGWTFQYPQHQLIPELAAAIRDGKVQDFFSALAPSSTEYMRLTEALKTYRAMKANGPWPQIPLGPTIKPNDTDPRVALVRARLFAEGYQGTESAVDESPDFYSPSLQTVISEYQLRNGLEVDGNIGGKTVNALNITLVRRLEQIIANMERLRAMPRTYPARYAMVNIADASVQIVEDGNVTYHASVVVGRPDRKTPFIKSAIRSVIFNPSWHVPAKIAREDILPKLRKDPHYLEKMGFVINSSDEDDPTGATIDWQTIQQSAIMFRLRQLPGELNSLGRIKFDFDNSFSVYMHGTPHEELFAKASRNLSSGCIRLKDPEDVAKIVLSFNEGNWDAPKIQGEVDKAKTHWLKVAKPLPLYVIYQTAIFPTPDGPIAFRNDVYNYDRILINAIKEKTE